MRNVKNTSFLQEIEYVADEQRVAAAAGHGATHTAACGIAAVCMAARSRLNSSIQRGGSGSPPAPRWGVPQTKQAP